MQVFRLEALASCCLVRRDDFRLVQHLNGIGGRGSSELEGFLTKTLRHFLQLSVLGFGWIEMRLEGLFDQRLINTAFADSVLVEPKGKAMEVSNQRVECLALPLHALSLANFRLKLVTQTLELLLKLVNLIVFFYLHLLLAFHLNLFLV